MKTYLQHSRRRQRKLDPSYFANGSVSRTKGMTYANSVGSGSTILGDLVIRTPPVMQGLSVRGAGVRFSLPRTSIPLSNVFPADATHVSPSTL